MYYLINHIAPESVWAEGKTPMLCLQNYNLNVDSGEQLNTGQILAGYRNSKIIELNINNQFSLISRERLFEHYPDMVKYLSNNA
ncbi:MAG TPA: hypothetical protein VM123_19915 [archaeon]|nr:hypothetical protein [archaeon]